MLPCLDPKGAASGVITRYQLQESAGSSAASAILKHSGTALSQAAGNLYYDGN